MSSCYNPLQDTSPITSAVLGHFITTHVPLIFLNRGKKSYRLSEKCATLMGYILYFFFKMLENDNLINLMNQITIPLNLLVMIGW